MAETLGKYQLDTKLAVGGMAEVLLARQSGPAGFEKQLVVKRILPQFSDDEQFIQMFLDEGRLLAQLAHPNIVQIFELGEQDEAYYIAMEYIHGESVGEVVDRCLDMGLPFPQHYAARIVANVCAGLDYAHHFSDAQGNPLNLVHRDISPDNVLVSFNGAVKMIDFGVAKAVTNRTKTQSGTVKGKFCFMSPEQIMGQPLDGRSDIFSAGIMLYEMVTGRKPFGDDNSLMTVSAIVNDVPKSPRDVMQGFPLELEAILMKALEKDVNRRYARARDMQRDLEHFIQSHATYIGDTELGDFVRRVRRGKGEDRDWIRGLARSVSPSPRLGSRVGTAPAASPSVGATVAVPLPGSPAGGEPGPRPMPTVASTKLDRDALKEAGRFGGVGVASGHLANMGRPSLPLGRLEARRKAQDTRRLAAIAVGGLLLLGLAVGFAMSMSGPAPVPEPVAEVEAGEAPGGAIEAQGEVARQETEPPETDAPRRLVLIPQGVSGPLAGSGPTDDEAGEARPDAVEAGHEAEARAPAPDSGGLSRAAEAEPAVGGGAAGDDAGDAPAREVLVKAEAPPVEPPATPAAGRGDSSAGEGEAPGQADPAADEAASGAGEGVEPAAPARAPQPHRPASAFRGQGRLLVDANVEGAEVWVGNRRLGRTPFRGLVTEGRYDVEVRWHKVSQTFPVRIDYDGKRHLTARFKVGTLTLADVPRGVVCSLDGRPLLREQHTRLSLPADGYEITCDDPAGEPYVHRVQLRSKQKKVVTYGSRL